MREGETVWDPFSGSLPARHDHVSRPVGAVHLPSWATLPLVVLAFAGMGYGIWMDGEGGIHQLAGFGTSALCIGAIVLASMLAKTDQTNRWLLSEVARRNAWSFSPVAKAHEVERNNSISERTEAVEKTRRAILQSGSAWDKFTEIAHGLEGTAERSNRMVYDPLVRPAYATIAPLLRPRPGQPMGVEINGLFWGETATGIPFWMGAGMMEMNLVLAGRSMKSDRHGNTGNHGQVITMAMAYRLNRDTGIEAALTAETFKRDAFTDLKTESSEFNDAFHVSIRADSATQGEQGRLALLSVLTPATQTRLLDLAARYKAQFMVANDVVYMSGYEMINVHEPERIAPILETVVGEFADAATSFKHYAE